MNNTFFEDIEVGLNIYEIDNPDTPAIATIAHIKHEDLPSDWKHGGEAQAFTIGLIKDLYDAEVDGVAEILESGFMVAVGYATESKPRYQMIVSDGITLT